MSEEGARLYGHIVTDDANIELTVEGNEDETSDDLSETFDDKINKLIEESKDLHTDERIDDGVQ